MLAATTTNTIRSLQKDYYKVVSIFANSIYTEYPVVSKVAADAWDKNNLQAAKLRADLRDYTSAVGKQLAEALSIQTSDYMTAAWNVLGSPKRQSMKFRQASTSILKYCNAGLITFPSSTLIPISMIGRR